jgi:Zn-dependent protease with chaperone function
MDFFHRQDQARRNTRVFIGFFAAAVLAIILAVYLAVAFFFVIGRRVDSNSDRGGRHRHSYSISSEPAAARELWNPVLFGWVSVGTLCVIIGGCLYKFAELSSGGASVATMLGGRLVNSKTTDPDERKLLNVVEEMAIASGVPVPQVYVLEGELGINAFAAGHSSGDSVIGVTQGCMRLLDRDELQGVIAHEFSHVLNGDMRLNLRLMGFIFGIMGLAIIGRILLEARGEKNPLPLLGLVLMVIGWAGVFFGHIIQAAVSREREVLADASAVQFTRNPAGLAGALKKIGGLSRGSILQSPRATEASHFFFANGLRSSLFNLFVTHPALEDRIRALEPDWDGTFPKTRAAEQPAPPVQVSAPSRPRVPFPFPRPAAGAVAGFAPGNIRAAEVIGNAGQPAASHLEYAANWRASLPGEIESEVHDPLGAMCIVLGSLMGREEGLRSRQMAEVARLTSTGIAQELARILPGIQSLDPQARLPLVNLALPALRGLSHPQYDAFCTVMQFLIESDGELDWFEFMLQKAVRRHLDPQFGKAGRAVVQFYSIKGLVPECVYLLSVLSAIGHEDVSGANLAFRAGWNELGVPDAGIDRVPMSTCRLDRIEQAMDRLSQSAPMIKQKVLQACARTVAADGVIKTSEAELLRAIADTLDCPIPPFIRGVATE